MRLFIGLLVTLSLSACAEPTSTASKKYLFNTERCADVAPKGSAEYADCEKNLAHDDAQRMYNLNSSAAKPGWIVLRSVF